MNITDLFKKIVRDEERDSAGEEAVVIIRDNEVVRRFISNPSNTLLISFPRTGSHWLRMLMELYFKRPTLKLIFYYPEVTDYLAYHTHDLDLDMEHPTVLYLYRDPTDTVYSQLNFYKEALDNTERITYWSDLYGRHLDKWLHQERFTQKKTVLRYEGLQNDMPAEFSKIVAHYGEALDAEKLTRAVARTTKQEIQRKVVHDRRVINTHEAYASSRDNFRGKQQNLVWDALLQNRPHLAEDFENK
jgi:hypothetical protein